MILYKHRADQMINAHSYFVLKFGVDFDRRNTRCVLRSINAHSAVTTRLRYALASVQICLKIYCATSRPR
jgi:predicted secreted Zn-dependent protease